MTDLLAVRWTRYGHDRLYVNGDDGQRVGWLDVRTGAVHLERPQLAEAFHAALAGHVASTSTTASAEVSAATAPGGVDAAPEVAHGAVLTESSPPETWVDLATHRPGQAARAQADASLAQMKERSRVGTFLARLVDAKTDERAWRVGATGEETVGALLEKLRDHGCYVLHAVPVGCRDADIDHVLVGPGGVFTVNTKTHPGGKVWVGQRSVRVNGYSVPYLRNSRFEAERAVRLLSEAVGWSLPVRAVLVILTGTLIPDVTIAQQPDDVLVLDRTDIPRAFRKAANRLSTEQVEQVYAVARRSTTWVPG